MWYLMSMMAARGRLWQLDQELKSPVSYIKSYRVASMGLVRPDSERQRCFFIVPSKGNNFLQQCADSGLALFSSCIWISFSLYWKSCVLWNLRSSHRSEGIWSLWLLPHRDAQKTLESMKSELHSLRLNSGPRWDRLDMVSWGQSTLGNAWPETKSMAIL